MAMMGEMAISHHGSGGLDSTSHQMGYRYKCDKWNKTIKTVIFNTNL